MGVLNQLLSVLSRMIGFAMIVFVIYYGISHSEAEVTVGVLHMPSLVFVALGLLAIFLSSYEIHLIAKTFWNLLFFSPSGTKKKLLRMEEILPELTSIYYEKGAADFLREVEKRNLTPLWKFMAIKLEAHIPVSDVRILVQQRGKMVNEHLFSQIRSLQGLATIAPAVGMTGTIMGLIRILRDIGDFSALAGNMALAFITALYGLLFGNFLFIPLVNRLNASREFSMQMFSQAVFWLQMIEMRKPADYMDVSETRGVHH